MPLTQQLQMWVDRGQQVLWNGRDTRGHFAKADDVANDWPDPPLCPHPCCKGKRKHPKGLPVMKAAAKKKPAPKKKKPAAKRKRTSAADRRADKLQAEFGGPWRSFHGAQSGTQRKASTAAQRKHDYAVYLHNEHNRAQSACNGHLVNAAGKRKGISGDDFFKPGPRPSVATYGTDEMREWARSHRVLSATAFHQRDQRKAA